MPSFDTRQLGKPSDEEGSYTPNSFVWEIGHTAVFAAGAQYCVPGSTICDSSNVPSWQGFHRFRLMA